MISKEQQEKEVTEKKKTADNEMILKRWMGKEEKKRHNRRERKARREEERRRSDEVREFLCGFNIFERRSSYITVQRGGSSPYIIDKRSLNTKDWSFKRCLSSSSRSSRVCAGWVKLHSSPGSCDLTITTIKKMTAPCDAELAQSSYGM